jgi:hypothetical protein
MPVVEEYWGGVLQRLQAEVDVFARLVRHYGEQGRANELALTNLLEAFVPGRIGVGTGMVIDRHDRYSRQTDIVLYEQAEEARVLAQATHLLHPVEGVLACVEVKTTLRSDDIADCIRKKKALLDLVPATSWPEGASHPLFIVLAYSSGISPEAVQKGFAEAGETARPDLLCVLDAAIVGGPADSLLGAPDVLFPTGLVFLHELAETGERTATYRAAETGSEEMVQVVGGRTYPIIDYCSRHLLGEPARALLLFVEAVARRLAQRQKARPPVLSYYLDERARQVEWLPGAT